MTEYFSDVDDRDALVDRERDPITGKRVPKRDSKRDSHAVQTATKRSLLVPAAIVAVVVLLLAGGAVALSKRNDGSKSASSPTTPPGGAASGTTQPSGAKSTTSLPGLSEISVIYAGGKITKLVNATANSIPPVYLRCKATGGCRFEAAGITPSAYAGLTGPWTGHEVEDMGPICITPATGQAAGHERFITDYVLHGEGTTTYQGIKIPAKVVGTYVSDVPGVPNCLQASHTEGTYDAKPTH